MLCQYMLEFVAISQIFLCSNAFAQKTAATSPHTEVAVKSQVPNRTLDLTHVEPLVGLPAATVTGDPICSSGGDIFSEIYGVSDKPDVAYFPEIYSISKLREVKKIKLPVPTGYKAFVLGSFFPATHRLVALILADQPLDPKTPQEKGKLTPFLSTVDRDGDQPNLVKLDLLFKPLKAAIFDTGEFLILGTDMVNLKPVLAIVHEDGSLNRMLDLDARKYESSQDLNQIYSRRANDSNTDAAQRLALDALSAAEFVPWGEEILLVQRGSTLPVYRFRSAALIGTVTIKPPDGFLTDSIMGSGEKDTWVVLTKDTSSFQKVANGGVVENSPEHIYEVNPRTGEVIDQLFVKGPQPGEIGCAADGRLTVIYYGLPQQADAPEKLVYASAPR
jgi:hypothetical protein